MLPEERVGHEVWRREVTWDKTSLQSYQKNYECVKKKLDDQKACVKDVARKVELYKRICCALQDGVVTVIAISAIMIVGLQFCEPSVEKHIFVAGWALLAATVSLALLWCSSHQGALEDKLSDETFKRDAFKLELEWIKDDIDLIEFRLANLKKVAPDEYDEIQPLRLS